MFSRKFCEIPKNIFFLNISILIILHCVQTEGPSFREMRKESLKINCITKMLILVLFQQNLATLVSEFVT